MAACTTVFRPCSPRSTRPGFSLLEVLVALMVMGVVMALATPLVMGARSIVKSDQMRTTANQGVRAASDIIGTDIRMAGERFPLSSSLPLPPVQVVSGGTDPDEISLRRNLWESAFPICADVATTHTTIRVVQPDTWGGAGAYPECLQPVDADGWPINLADASELADAIGVGGVLRGYIYDPANDRGEFFDFRIEDDADDTHRITKTGGNLQFPYALANRARIYILEDRRYRLRGDTLELLVNGAAPLRVAAGITDMRARNVMNDGSVTTTIALPLTWRDIVSVELTVTATATEGIAEAERSLTTRYFPRNVLSR